MQNIYSLRGWTVYIGFELDVMAVFCFSIKKHHSFFYFLSLFVLFQFVFKSPLILSTKHIILLHQHPFMYMDQSHSQANSSVSSYQRVQRSAITNRR